MLMLYLFKVEVFDLRLSYPYSTNSVIIADTREDRSRLLRLQFGDRDGIVVKRSVLLGARTLTCREVSLLDMSVGTSGSIWLTTRVRTVGAPHARHLPRLQSEEEMYEITERVSERYDSFPLGTDQYIHGVRFSQSKQVEARLAPAA
jgi:hypothetical protein